MHCYLKVKYKNGSISTNCHTNSETARKSVSSVVSSQILINLYELQAKNSTFTINDLEIMKYIADCS
jgi:hypothetical protein